MSSERREPREPEEWRFTNALMRQAILAIGEVMGESGLKIVLRQFLLEGLLYPKRPVRDAAGSGAEHQMHPGGFHSVCSLPMARA